MYLSAAELIETTGFKQPAKQAIWLALNGYSFDVRADGRPNVLKQQIFERQCKGAVVKPKLNLAALDRLS